MILVIWFLELRSISSLFLVEFRLAFRTRSWQEHFSYFLIFKFRVYFIKKLQSLWYIDYVFVTLGDKCYFPRGE